ncbi:MAG: von Willebrand factor type like domain [Myxococcales bacterium]|nr:von Willebrand factor type like domain [Myxococcales bacterium]
MSIRALPLVCLAFTALSSAYADPAPQADKTLSPYFVVEGASPGVESMPLESTRADVHIAGVIADVTVKQMYRNDGAQTISARYVFPASTRAAVHGMKMTIGSRVIVAKIKEREEARAEYEEAKATGRTASLLEEDRPNVFSMNVANILPKDHIEVELKYTELLLPTDGTYELVYPTVVGPRYTSGAADPTEPTNQFIAAPYTHAGKAPPYDFGVHVTLGAGMPIQSIDSPSHPIKTAFGANNVTATVDLDDKAGGNRDFILHYRLGGTDIASGLLLFQGAKENFFLMMVQPPRRPAIEMIPAREYVFIIDVSGSMIGHPLDITKKLMRDLLGKMRPNDRFNVLLFSGASDLYAKQSVSATPTQIADAIKFIDSQQGGGGTELLPALQRAMSLPRPEANVSRSFVVVTDGFIGEETAMFDQVRDHLGEANVFAFGIGSSVNRHLIEGVAKAGQGEPFVVEDEKLAPEAAKKFRTYIESPVLTSVKVAFDGFSTYDVEPRVLPDVFAERPVVVFGKWRGTPTGKLTLTGVSGRGRFVSTLDASAVKPDASNEALSYLWARSKISRLSDFTLGDENRKDVIALGLEYNLLTKYTSFIAVQQVVRAAGSIDVDQALPLPVGVSESAVGMEVGPEPALDVLIAFVLFAVGWQLFRRRTQRAA